MRRLQSIVMAMAIAMGGSANADTLVSDRAAALLVYPYVFVQLDLGNDTLIQISNTSDDPVAVQCYYVSAVGECSLSGGGCDSQSDCPSASDICLRRWSETDFRVYLTARQPMAWLASQGLSRSDLPLNGTLRRGPGGQSNAGTAVPPFGVEYSNLAGRVAIGELRCYTVEADGSPSERNVLIGNATGTRAGGDEDGVRKYSALGFRALPGAGDGNDSLVLGGEGAEYDGCPNVLILNHFFDGAADPTWWDDPVRRVYTNLTLSPCSANYRTQEPTRVVAQYLVFNEFEQRLSTSRLIDCFDNRFLSQTDTNQMPRSIFSVGVSGTLTGQTRIRGVSGGLVGVATEVFGDGDGPARSDAFNLHLQGERAGADVVTVVR